MALSHISGHDGSVTKADHGGKVTSWSLSFAMATKDVSGYGDGRFTKHRGGVLTYNATLNILLQQGATATAPNFTAPSIDGSTITLTSMTGCAHSGTALYPSGSIEHAYADPAVGGTYNCLFNGTVSEVWATS